MWFKRKHNEYGCPMCGRPPASKEAETRKYDESRKVTTGLTSTGDNEPRFFCPLHLRYRPDPPDGSQTVFFEQPTLHALNRFYEGMSTPQPLPKPECEDTIPAILTSEDTK